MAPVVISGLRSTSPASVLTDSDVVEVMATPLADAISVRPRLRRFAGPRGARNPRHRQGRHTRVATPANTSVPRASGWRVGKISVTLKVTCFPGGASTLD